MAGLSNAELLGWLTFVLALFQALGIVINKLWLESTLKFELRKREQAALVARLFAEWLARSDKKELNRLAWEATLWLPDDLALAVNRRLQNAKDAEDLKQILVKVKGLLHGRQSKLNWQDITHY